MPPQEVRLVRENINSWALFEFPWAVEKSILSVTNSQMGWRQATVEFFPWAVCGQYADYIMTILRLSTYHLHTQVINSQFALLPSLTSHWPEWELYTNSYRLSCQRTVLMYTNPSQSVCEPMKLCGGSFRGNWDCCLYEMMFQHWTFICEWSAAWSIDI